MAAKSSVIRLGAFELGEMLSELPYGTVYEAKRSSDGLRAAVTVVSDAHSAAGDAFLGAAEKVQGLVHDHIVTIHECGRSESGAPWIATDLLAGSPLSTEIDEDGRLAEPRAASIAQQVLSALGALHDRGVVHEGLTPGSIVLTETAGADDHVRILCFGTLAKLRRGTSAADGDLALSLAEVRYAAPEQLDGGAESPAGDLYSCGLILFEMLAGIPANGAEDLDAARERQLAGKLKLPSDLAKRPITKAMALALVKDPAKRYRSAKHFSDALERIPGLKPTRPLSIVGPGSYAGGTAGKGKPSSLADLRARLSEARKQNEAGKAAEEKAARAIAEASEGGDEHDAPTMLVGLDALQASADAPAVEAEGVDDSTTRVSAEMLEEATGTSLSGPHRTLERAPADAPSADVESAAETTSSAPDSGDAALVSPPLPSPPLPSAPSEDGFAEMSLSAAAASLSSSDSVPKLSALTAGADASDSVPEQAADVVIAPTMATMAGDGPLIPTPRPAQPDPEPEAMDPATDDALVVTGNEGRSTWMVAAIVILSVAVVVLLYVVFSGGETEEADDGAPDVVAQEPTDENPGEAGATSESTATDEGELAAGIDGGEPGDEALDDEPIDGEGEFDDTGEFDDEGMALDDDVIDGEGESFGDDVEMDFGDEMDADPEPVLFALSTAPAGAEVISIGDESVLCEATPCEVAIGAGTAALDVVVRLEGHEPSELTLDPAAPAPVELALVPAEVVVAAGQSESGSTDEAATSEPPARTEKKEQKKKRKKKKKKKKDDNPFGARTFD